MIRSPVEGRVALDKLAGQTRAVGDRAAPEGHHLANEVVVRELRLVALNKHTRTAHIRYEQGTSIVRFGCRVLADLE